MRQSCWKSLLLLLLALITSASDIAQSTTAPKGTAVGLDELRREGSEALFNLEYDAARRKVAQMTELYPDDPTGPQMLATTLWLEALHHLRLLQTAIYSTQSFYSGPQEKTDPRLVTDFDDLTRKAEQLARARLRRDPRDVRALYVFGETESLRAAFAATLERRFIGALRSASTGIKTQRDVLKLDPNFHDAELSIGMYEYIVGTLPLPARMLANVAGVSGSKKNGIQTLERVAKDGEWVRDDAKVLLIGIYKKEKRWPEALALSRELGQKYPRNYLFSLETADALVSEAALARQAGKPREAETLESEAVNTFERMLRERSVAGALDLINFRYGEALVMMGQPDRAAKEFLAAATVSGADAGTVSRAHLRAAQSFDLAGKRNEALAEYRVVLSRPNLYDFHDQARRGQKERYRRN